MQGIYLNKVAFYCVFFTVNAIEESVIKTVDFANRCKFLINFFIVLASYSFCAQHKVALKESRGSFVLLYLHKRVLSMESLLEALFKNLRFKYFR